MNSSSNIDLKAQIKQIVESKNYSLYDIEIVRENDITIFRVSITSLNGINHHDCQVISDIISPLLDVYDPIAGEYHLEVSSPGLERKLKNPNHFNLSKGEKIQITLNDKTKITGILGNSTQEYFILDDVEYKYSDIKSAKSVFDW